MCLLYKDFGTQKCVTRPCPITLEQKILCSSRTKGKRPLPGFVVFLFSDVFSKSAWATTFQEMGKNQYGKVRLTLHTQLSLSRKGNELIAMSTWDIAGIKTIFCCFFGWSPCRVKLTLKNTTQNLTRDIFWIFLCNEILTDAAAGVMDRNMQKLEGGEQRKRRMCSTDVSSCATN
jgi:hypothetical protein